MAALTLVTAPSSGDPVVTSTEAKLYARQDETADDTLFTGLIAAATKLAEKWTRRFFVTQTWKYFIDCFPGNSIYPAFLRVPMAIPAPDYTNDQILIPRPPLLSITHIKYYDTSGTQQTLSSANYQVDVASEPGRIIPSYGNTWPATRYPYLNAVEIQFVAGYGAASAVPDDIKTAIKLLINHWYDIRLPVEMAVQAREIPMSVGMILDSYKVVDFCLA